MVELAIDVPGVSKDAHLPAEDSRISELSSLTKSLILRSVSDEIVYNMVKSTLISLNKNVEASLHLSQTKAKETAKY